jgi:putative heme iron utilization protein
VVTVVCSCRDVHAFSKRQAVFWLDGACRCSLVGVNRHAGPPRASDAPDVPEPTFPERARTLAHLGHTGTLATLSRRHVGHPFASVMPYALDEAGRPLFLISSMAMHTQNLEVDARASLLVTQPDWSGDPLAAGRLTLMGEGRKLTAADGAGARAAYLARHARASYWVDFDDFAFWRLDVVDVYFVGGFAAMDWVTAAAYAEARPDPLADAGPGIVEHMNRDHADALLAYARHYAGETADEASMVTVDRLGFKLRLRQGERLSSVRIAFPREVTSAGQSREVLIEMLRVARGG